jgi:CBS domain containing-hemolysin-like protein
VERVVTGLLLAALLVAANGFFVATEFALARVRPTQVGEWVREGRPGARSLQHGVERIDAYLAACQLGITLASLGLGVVGEPAFHDLLEPVLGDAARVGSIGLAGAVAFAIITLLHVVLGELSPKSLAIARNERTALLCAPVMRGFYFLTKPLVDLFNGLGNLVLKPFGVPPAREAGHVPHSEDELRLLVRQSSAEGLIDAEEQRFTENVFSFGDRRAREVMVPRPEVRFLTTDLDVDAAARTIRETGLTRLPLCEPDGGLDRAVGLVHAKALLLAGDRPLTELARPLERVPEGILIDELLEHLRARREHLVLVVDEHGTSVGIVTLEDVLEEIVGEIEDEFDPDRPPPIDRRDDGTFVRGDAGVHDVEVELGLAMPDAHEATVGGYVLERVGRIPAVGDRIELEDGCLEVTGVDEAQITELRVVDAGD